MKNGYFKTTFGNKNDFESMSDGSDKNSDWFDDQLEKSEKVWQDATYHRLPSHVRQIVDRANIRGTNSSFTKKMIQTNDRVQLFKRAFY